MGTQKEIKKREGDYFTFVGVVQGQNDGIWRAEMKHNGNPMAQNLLFSEEMLESRMNNMESRGIIPDQSMKALDAVQHKAMEFKEAPVQRDIRRHRENEKAALMSGSRPATPKPM